jgi:hypothetical protein
MGAEPAADTRTEASVARRRVPSAVNAFTGCGHSSGTLIQFQGLGDLGHRQK